MSYYCKACTYRGAASDSGGACPACGSYNLGGNRGAQALEEPAISAKWRLWILVGLWTTLFVMVAGKLLQTT